MADDDMQRGPQLMGHGRDKLRLCPSRVPQFFVGLPQFQGLLFHFGKQSAIFDRHSYGVADGFKKLEFVDSELMARTTHQMKDPLDLVIGLNGESSGRFES